MKRIYFLIFIILFGVLVQGCAIGRLNTGINTDSSLTQQTNQTQQSTEVQKSTDTQQTTETKQTDASQQIDETKPANTAAEPGSIVYRNSKYGFDFTLPASWENYTIVNDKWEGLSLDGTSSEKVVETSDLIYIRHPKWTPEKERQDIPVMVFTIKQWNSLEKGDFHIGAAPIGPSELGRNNKFVFALPARYNFAFPEGYKEVENILEGKPLKPFDIENKTN